MFLFYFPLCVSLSLFYFFCKALGRWIELYAMIKFHFSLFTHAIALSRYEKMFCNWIKYFSLGDDTGKSKRYTRLECSAQVNHSYTSIHGKLEENSLSYSKCVRISLLCWFRPQYIHTQHQFAFTLVQYSKSKWQFYVNQHTHTPHEAQLIVKTCQINIIG